MSILNSGAEYVTSIGFRNPIQVPTRNHFSLVRAFSYSEFCPERVRGTLGKPSRFSAEGVFVFRIAVDRAIRVNTSKRTILLVSGRSAVRILMEMSKKTI